MQWNTREQLRNEWGTMMINKDEGRNNNETSTDDTFESGEILLCRLLQEAPSDLRVFCTAYCHTTPCGDLPGLIHSNASSCLLYLKYLRIGILALCQRSLVTRT